MGRRWGIGAGALLLALAAAAAAPAAARAEKTFLFYGGVNHARLGGNTRLFGDQMASVLEDVVGGTWTAAAAGLDGLALGAGKRVVTSRHFGLQYEAAYVQRGMRYDMATSLPDGMADLDADVDLKLTYLELSFMVNMAADQRSSPRVFCLLGPELGLKTSSDLKVSAEGQSDSSGLDHGVAGVNLGVNGGVGVAFRVGGEAEFVAQARYHLGLVDMLDNMNDTNRSEDLMFVAGLELVTAH